VAESKRRGKNAAGEHLDEVFDDAVDDDAPEDDDDVIEVGARPAGTGRGGTAVKARSRAGGGSIETGRSVRTRTEESPGLFDRLGRFFREVVSELRKVIWPTRKELLTYTSVVVVFVAVILTVVGLLDLGFAKAVLFVFGGKK
jgi:preprotein translocase subunit SecE